MGIRMGVSAERRRRPSRTGLFHHNAGNLRGRRQLSRLPALRRQRIFPVLLRAYILLGSAYHDRTLLLLQPGCYAWGRNYGNRRERGTLKCIFQSIPSKFGFILEKFASSFMIYVGANFLLILISSLKVVEKLKTVAGDCSRSN